VSAGTPVNQASPFRDRQRAQLVDALKRLRLAAGLTSHQLGEQIGVDQSTVSRIERSRQRISMSQVDLCSS
jgi:transcriptional regulator with XRE-family HTH domain